MTQIKPTKPVAQRQSPFNDKAYQKTFKDIPCEACGINDGTVVGAHFNFEGGGKGLKQSGVVAALCFDCHNIADGRTNVPEKERVKIWLRVLKTLLRDRSRKWAAGRKQISDNENERTET